MVRPTNSFRRNEPGGATAKLITRFKQLISQRELLPGAKLPPERELAKRFNVNRSTLRQMLKILEIMGVVSQRVGDGTYLNTASSILLDEPLDFLILMEDTSHQELFEMRVLVEPELAYRAAEHATTEDLAQLRRAIQAMEGSPTRQARLKSDVDFHEAIFQAAGIGVSYLIVSVIHRALRRSMAPHLAKDVKLERPLTHHKAIYQAIYERKPHEARQRMIDHLTDARLILAEKGDATAELSRENIRHSLTWE